MDVRGIVVAHITALLKKHDCVIVPGLGGFLLQEQSAKMHPTAFIFQPPTATLLFNERLQQTDGLLEQAVAIGEGLSRDKAKQLLEQFVYDFHYAVRKGEIVKLSGVGRLQQNAEGKLQFQPDLAVNYSRESFGLPTFTRQPIVRRLKPEEEVLTGALPTQEVVEEVPLYQPTAPGKFWMPIAAVLLLSLASIQLWMNADNYGIDFAGWGSGQVVSGKAYTVADITDATTNAIAASRTTDSIAVEETDALSLVWGNEPSYWIVVGAFRESENAMGFCSRLHDLHVGAIRLESGSYSMVVVPVYQDEDPVETRSAVIQRTGIKDAWLMKNAQ